MIRPQLIDRVREAVHAQHAAEQRQLALPEATASLGLTVEALILRVLAELTAIHGLSQAPPAASQRLQREAYCANAAILLALIGAHPTTHA